ncbi:hypothetical protein E8E13_002077 [Curvularia kusanoi]|uniref:Uncharacterized protein n=1 Tax=Curvularia kusanoi TaxID=90978 RepID=A0A9P4W5B8_CURKU|nr:hypothetical protein E8E13_002077 [Curvularia kusanoi]
MLRSTCMLVLSLAAAALAQESSYTGPPFDPSKEPYFAQTGLVIPTATDLPAIEPSNAFSMATTIPGIIIQTSSRSLPAIEPSNQFSMATTISGIILPSTTPRSSSHASSSRSSASGSTSSGSAAATSATSSAPATQSSGAAVANRVGFVGAVAGGLLAGLALA